MNKNLDLTKILKNCPKGTKFYSTIYGEVYFKEINLKCDYQIVFTLSNGCNRSVTSNGINDLRYDGECILFPSKEQRDWSKWCMPFVNGDIIFYDNKIAIFKEWDNRTEIKTYATLYENFKIGKDGRLFGEDICIEARLATEEEKQKLFNVIKDNDYKWNTDKKRFEKIVKFNDGDIVFICTKDVNEYRWLAIFKEIKDDKYITYFDLCIDNDHFFYYKNDYSILCDSSVITEQRLATENEKQQLFYAIKKRGYSWNAETKTLVIEPRFKAGDIIQDVDKYKVKITEVNLEDEVYDYESLIAKGIGGIGFNEQNNWKLVHNKFNTNTLKPFDKVLVRNRKENPWIASYFSHNNRNKICAVNGFWKYCIPYNNETAHLVGTNNEEPEYYKQED